MIQLLDRFRGCLLGLAETGGYDAREQILRFSAESSHTTHGARECLDACRPLGAILWRAIAALWCCGRSRVIHCANFGASRQN
jgi:hypothetical protein